MLLSVVSGQAHISRGALESERPQAERPLTWALPSLAPAPRRRSTWVDSWRCLPAAWAAERAEARILRSGHKLNWVEVALWRPHADAFWTIAVPFDVVSGPEKANRAIAGRVCFYAVCKTVSA